MSTTSRHLGKYELLRQLGQGTVGEVWKAQDTQLRRDVALKIIHTDLQSDPNFLTRFTTEGQEIASLQHPNIVPLREIDIARSPESNATTAYMVMDYIEGRTLSDYLQATSHRGNFPSVAQIVYLFTTLGVAIDYAHQKGIVHGNIKPANILLNKQDTGHFEAGEPMLTDFGFARILGSNSGSIASPHYMSPEQAKGETPNNRSDIYALGVILYEICTGVQPFRDESTVAIMMQHINTLPTPPMLINPNIPPALSEAILRAMAKDTATRFPMASLLATAIADACSMQRTIHPAAVQAAQEEEVSYPRSGPLQNTILGVAQPNTTPQPALSPRVSQPLPAVSAPLPAITGRFAVASNNTMPTPALTNKLPATTLSGKVPIPPMSSISRKLPVPMPATPPPTAYSYQDQATAQISAKLPATPPMPLPPRVRSFTDVPMYVVVVALLLLLLVIGSAISANLLLRAREQPAAASTIGSVYFQDDALGHNDTLRIQMQNLPAPPQGKSYFAWLQNNDQQTLPLGQLTVNNGSASFLYPGTSQHSNLLTTTQGIKVTLENTDSSPTTPSADIRYQATFDPVSFPAIKAILDATPELSGKQSVIVALLEQIKSINDKAGSIVDSLQGTHDYGLVHRQAIRIVEIIDNTAYARATGDLPTKEPSLAGTVVGLTSSPDQKGLIDILATHVAQAKQVAGSNPSLMRHIQNVEYAISDLQDWVQKMRTYTVHILKAADLTDPAIIGVALQLKKAAADSYTGRTIPPNEGPQPTPGSAGANQAYIESQYLATLDFKKV